MPSSFRRFAGGRPRRSCVAAAATVLLGLAATPGVAWAKTAEPDPGTAITSTAPPPASPAAPEVIGGGRLAEPGIVVDTSGTPPLPPISATSFVIADADTGAVLAAHNAHEKLAPASTLKTLTAITLLPRVKATFPTMAQSDAPSVDGTKAGIVAGTMYKAGDLFTAMLMMSANDAAVALADANGGLSKTLAEMNAEAAQLHAGDTVAKTPNGLDAPGQSSSAYDLALIFRAGLANPDFRHYLALTSAAFPAPGGKSFQIQTHDHLLTDYPGMVGGKNGYTVAAQASYVGAATRDGHTIIVAVMRDQPNFWNEVKTLLDWGFAADSTASAVGTLVDPVPPTPTPTPTHTPAATLTAAATLPQPPASQGAGIAAAPPSTDALANPGSRAEGQAGVTAAGAKAANGGVSIGGVVTWVAVGVGGLLFLTAVVRLLAGRRRRRNTDDRYLAGLSRLSALGQVSDRPS